MEDLLDECAKLLAPFAPETERLFWENWLAMREEHVQNVKYSSNALKHAATFETLQSWNISKRSPGFLIVT